MSTLKEQIAAIHAEMEAKHLVWKAAEPKFVAVDLPLLPAVRTDLDGHTVTIERDAATLGRVVAERIDGRLVALQRDEDPIWDETLVRQAENLAYEIHATFIKDALRLPACPVWCVEEHTFPDEDHHGPGAFFDVNGCEAALLIALEQEPDGAAAIIVRPHIDGPRATSVAQIKALIAELTELLPLWEKEVKP